MKITHLIESTNPKGGGLPASVIALAEKQCQMGHKVTLVTLDHSKDNLNQEPPRFDIINIKNFKLESDANAVKSIFHLHGIWNIKLWMVALSMQKQGHKLILSPHGQLMPTLISADSKFKKLKKIAFRKLLFDRWVRKINIIHAVCEAEKYYFLKYYPKVHCVAIYNYLDKEIWEANAFVFPKKMWDNEIVFTFIGRIDERKGILDLVNSFSCLETKKKLRLKIIGPHESEKLLKRISKIISKKKSLNVIEVLPPLYFNAKICAYQDSAFVLLPSYSEVVGLVNIEAALMKKCVITTVSANISEIGMNGGFIIETGGISITKAILEASQLSYDDYHSRCEALYSWAKSEFHPCLLNKKWNALYKTVYYTDTSADHMAPDERDEGV